MPNPKRRHSNSRTGKRRAHQRLAATTLVHCSQCHTLKSLHRVCPSCGFYKGNQIIRPKEKKKKGAA